MPKYLAEVYETIRYWVPIEAEDEEEAWVKADELTIEEVLNAGADPNYRAFDVEGIKKDA